MINSYIKITIRNMVRNKLFTVINVLGLSVSMACCLLLFLYVSGQLSYDEQHGPNVYRVTSSLSQKTGQVFNAASTSVPVASGIKAEIPEIMNACKLTSSTILGGKDMITYNGESNFIENGVVADTSLFSILKFDLVSGNISDPLPNPNAVVLSTALSIRIFGSENPVGKTIKITTAMGASDFEVTAVYNEKKYSSHLDPSFIISSLNAEWNNFFQGLSGQWVSNNLVYTYIKLHNGADPIGVEKKINEVFQAHGVEEMKAIGLNKVMHLQPVEKIHTTSGYEVELGNVTSRTFIDVLMGIGVLILILACVNYVNLSTAQAGSRSLEVGVRKVMGVTNKGLVFQFLGESFLIVLVSLCFSILFAQLSLPVFNQLVDHPVVFTPEAFGLIAMYGLAFLVITAFVAGIYPAVYLASFKPTAVLKGRNRDRGGALAFRNVLVIFQFVISIVLISAILIISDQVDFIKNKDLGFKASSRVVLPLSTQDVQHKFGVLKQRVARIAQVKRVGGSSVTPGMRIINDFLVYKKGQGMEDAIHIYNDNVDENYLQTIGVDLIAGDYFTDKTPRDSVIRIILNREATRKLGLTPEESIGENLFFDWRGRKFQFEVVGVVQDINQLSLHEGIEPLMFSYNPEELGYLILETNVEDYASVTANLKTAWKEINPDHPFEYFTLSDHLLKQYASDFKTFNLIKYFAFISVFISCMGLYALSLFIAERRFKEIGVRKTLGADVKDILILVSRDLSLLVIVAFVISIPVSMFGMSRWLQTFTYHITPGVGTYILAGFISIMIGWATISYQSFRAARTNPVNVLKDE
jgi:putative ABC transport system permease protein